MPTKLARIAGLMTAFLLGVHFVGRGLLASAIAHAPNSPLSVEPAPDQPPPELGRYRVLETLRVPVGPPTATLAAWVLEPPDGRTARGSVVLLHGVRLDKRSLLPTARALSDAGFRSILVDLRGHGRSSGAYLTYGVLESRDVSQLLDALEARGVPLGPVGAYGFSYGGATALHLAATDPRIGAVVAVSAFSSLRGVVRDYLVRYAPALAPGVPNVWLDDAVDLGGRWAAFDPDAAAPARAVSSSHASLLIVHGGADEQVPPYHAALLEKGAARAGRRVSAMLLPSRDHASMMNDSKVESAACEWFGQELGRKSADPVGACRSGKI